MSPIETGKTHWEFVRGNTANLIIVVDVATATELPPIPVFDKETGIADLLSCFFSRRIDVDEWASLSAQLLQSELEESVEAFRLASELVDCRLVRESHGVN